MDSIVPAASCQLIKFITCAAIDAISPAIDTIPAFLKSELRCIMCTAPSTIRRKPTQSLVISILICPNVTLNLREIRKIPISMSIIFFLFIIIWWPYKAAPFDVIYVLLYIRHLYHILE